MEANQRRHDRTPVDLEVRFEWEGAIHTARSRDLSLGGMFVVSEVSLPVGTELLLEIRFPVLSAPTKIACTVRWTGPGGMGVQFGRLRAWDAWAIHRVIAG